MPASVGDYAMLSDCRTAALVDRSGSVEWWPGPSFDGPSVFTRMLDPDAGHFSLRPVGPARSTRRYLEGTLVLETAYATKDGTLCVTDALALEVGARGHEIGIDSPGALLRVAEARGGDVELDVELVPRLEYGLAIPRVTREDGMIATVGGPERLFLSGGDDLEVEGGSARGRIRLRAGERRGFALHRRTGVLARPPAMLDAIAAMEATVASWRSWSEMHQGYDGPYRDEVLHGALLIQGLTYQPSGAVVAAASTSLPEIAGGEANWDYRYAWLRDASLIARALLAATCADEAKRYFEWMARAAVSCRHSDDVQIVFGADGARNLDERHLDHLRGFASSRPVRIGNAAWRQTQLDVLGEVLDVAEALGDDLTVDDFTASFLCQLADRAASDWKDPDAGVWESRGPEEHHTFSKAMCWVSLDRASRLAPRLGDSARPGEWGAAAQELRRVVLRDAYSDERNAFTGELGGRVLDASVLLLPLVGFVEADDPRMTATVAAIREHLGRDGLIRRREDMDEGAFLPACFWLAACQALAGEIRDAEVTFERAAACANDVGMLAEMTEAGDGRAAGNVPQALSHVGLIHAAKLIGEAKQAEAGAAEAHAPAR